ncbi:hypothetical protein O181_090253 [Austropuccinia psidii MF-1]|uniref:Uncharacterized protein n=1 Tax=Austropuccinia psidii MF-1 TaxID=1389203 RepID=A0A9Q3IUR0_9BASI|nr:hypothetical protein [Austropuccinia psidii MF-1]
MSPRGKQNFFQPEEEGRRPLYEETDGLSPRGTQKQKLFVPTNIINSSDWINPELMTENTVHDHEFDINEPVNHKLTCAKLAQFIEWTHETSQN